MSICVLQNLEKDRVVWTDFLASCREINRFSVSKIGPEPAKPTISLALIGILTCQVLRMIDQSLDTPVMDSYFSMPRMRIEPGTLRSKVEND